MSAQFYTSSLDVAEIVAGDFPLVTRAVVISSGTAALTRGAVLGRITTSGEYTLSLSASSDGSQTPIAILADEEVDATSADVGATVYLTGQFNPAHLTFGTGHTAASTRDGLRDLSIFI